MHHQHGDVIGHRDLLPSERAAVDEQGRTLTPRCGHQRIHDPAGATDRVVLGTLRETRQRSGVDGGARDPGERRAERDPERGRRRESRAARQVARDGDVETRQRMPRRQPCRDQTPRMIGPVPRDERRRCCLETEEVFGCIDRGPGGFECEVERTHRDAPVVAPRDGDDRAPLERTGQNEPVVVVRMLTDQIHPPRRERQHFRRASVGGAETRDDTGLECVTRHGYPTVMGRRRRAAAPRRLRA